MSSAVSSDHHVRRSFRRGAIALASATVLAIVGAGAAGASSPPPSTTAPDSGLGANPGWVPPPNDQVGSGIISVKCSVDFAGIPLLSATALAHATGSLPAVVHPGQTYDVSNGRTQVTLPAYLSDLMYLIGVRSVQPKVTKTTFVADGANPATVDVTATNNITVPAVPVQWGQPFVVTVGYDKPFTFGPFPANNPGLTHLALGEIDAAITPTLIGGITLPLPITTVCPVPNPPQYLATINVAGAPATGNVSVAGNFAAATVPANSFLGSTGAQYECSFNGGAPVAVEEAMTAGGSFDERGLVLSPGQQLQFTDTHGFLVIDPPAMKAIEAAVHAEPGTKKAVAIRPTLTKVDITGLNVSPAAANFLPSSINGDVFPLDDTATQTDRFPANGQDVVPFTFTAGSSGVLDVFLGDAAGTFQPLNAKGKPVGKPITISCPTPQPTVPLFPAYIAS